ncbi:MAG: TonB-dependent receptor, partial [Planctomycetota bacterium]
MSRNRMLRIAAALLMWLAASGPLSAQQTDPRGVVSGTVVGRFQGDPMPLAFATLEALAPGFRRSVVADSLGQYRIEGLPAGPVRLQVTHPGHEALELEVLVPGSGSIRVDLELRGRPVELPPVDVTRNPRIPDPDAREVDPAAISRVESIALEAGVGVGMPGLVEAVQSMPGNDPANPTDVLFMRGSTTDLKLVLLNGVPVFTPFHVAGLLTSFEPSLIDRATLHVGGAPARYDGGLTYILDLGTRRPARDRLHMSGALDLLSGSMGIDAPLGSKGAVLLSGRTLHNAGDEPLGGTSPYGYSDLMGALEFEPAPGHLFSASGFWNRESVLLDFDAPLPMEAQDGAWWSNRAAGLTYFGDLGGLTAEVTVAASTYDATLPLLPGATEEEPDPASLLATAATDRVRVVAEVARPSPQGVSRIGVSFERQEAAYDARSLAEGSVPSRTLANAHSGGAFLDATRTLNPDVTVRFG